MHGRIDRLKIKPWRDKNYLAWIRELPCVHCGSWPTEAHHLISLGIGEGVMGDKMPDYAAIPLCHACHQSVHHGERTGYQIRWLFETLKLAFHYGKLDFNR